MKVTALLTAFIFAATPAMVPVAAFAAHAGAPNKNVNKKNDAGNDTGDSRVEQLNQDQLNKIAGGQSSAPSAAPAATSR